MVRCLICLREIDSGLYCSPAHRRLGARAREDPIATASALYLKARQRCIGCGASLSDRRRGTKWCGEACRARHRDLSVRRAVAA